MKTIRQKFEEACGCLFPSLSNDFFDEKQRERRRLQIQLKELYYQASESLYEEVKIITENLKNEQLPELFKQMIEKTITVETMDAAMIDYTTAKKSFYSEIDFPIMQLNIVFKPTKRYVNIIKDLKCEMQQS